MTGSDDGTSDSPKKRSSGYTKEPEIPRELVDRFIEMVRILAGEQTVTGAAKKLGLSRVQMQTVQHRFIEGAIVGMSARPGGRKPKPERERELEDRVKALERELRQTQEHAAMLERFVEVAGELVRASPSTRRGRRSRSSSSEASSSPEKKPEEPGATRTKMVERVVTAVKEMRSAGMKSQIVSKLVDVAESTLRRWLGRAERGEPLLASRRSTPQDLPAALRSELAGLVRETNGAIGADALRHAVPGVSRRKAAAVKAETTTLMERERIERSEPVLVTAPGVMRGFDAMQISTRDGPRWLLVAIDASVPYRTSLALVERYDGEAVLSAIERDLDAHGAPLVWRMDRASSHRVPAVRALLHGRGVLVLHGPPRLPRFYGQLERENHPHRQLLAALGDAPDPANVAAYLPMLRHTLNERWPLRALGWETPGQRWTTRPDVGHHRSTLHAYVQQRAARIAVDVDGDMDLASRIAIESALCGRGLLQLTTGAALNGITR